MPHIRPVQHVIQSHRQSEGGGFIVRRPLPTVGLEQLDPFLLIDELGYTSLEKDQAGLFFELMKRRHKKHCTILTTQLGFEEWASFLQSPHLTAALLDRITVNCAVFNMKTCISIRPKRIVYGSDSQESGKKK